MIRILGLVLSAVAVLSVLSCSEKTPTLTSDGQGGYKDSKTEVSYRGSTLKRIKGNTVIFRDDLILQVVLRLIGVGRASVGYFGLTVFVSALTVGGQGRRFFTAGQYGQYSNG